VADQTVYKTQIPPVFSPGVFYWALFVVLLFHLVPVRSSAQPKFEIAETKKNFGHVKRGEMIKNIYEIRNAGNQPLIITSAEVACSCTSVDLPKEPILPGKQTIITVTFNTTSVYGRQDRIVVLKSNDPRGDMKIRFKGSVSKE